MKYSSPSLLVVFAVVFAIDCAHGDMKPTKFAKEVVCEGCHAVISEANKILGRGQRNDRTIQNAMRAMCNVQRLNQYEFSPPTMNKVCDYWTQNYDAEVKATLTSGLPEDEQEIQLCWLTTDICRGVDRSRFRINKYEGPSKRKILAATKAAKEAATAEETADEPAAETDDVDEQQADVDVDEPVAEEDEEQERERSEESTKDKHSKKDSKQEEKRSKKDEQQKDKKDSKSDKKSSKPSKSKSKKDEKGRDEL